MSADLPANEPSDRELLQRFQNGEQLAATALYLRYAPRLLALAESAPLAGTGPSPGFRRHRAIGFPPLLSARRKGGYDVPAGAELWSLLLVIALNKIRTAEAYHRAGKRDVGSTATPDNLDESLSTDTDGNGAYLGLVVTEARGAAGAGPARDRRIAAARV